MKTYCVSYTFGASILIEAANKDEALEKLDRISTQDLIDLAWDGFSVHDITEESDD